MDFVNLEGRATAPVDPALLTCANTLVVSGTPDLRAQVAKMFRPLKGSPSQISIIGLDRARPQPNSEPRLGWILWRIREWGPIGNTYNGTVEHRDDEDVYRFQTSLRPPGPWLVTSVAPHFPGAKFSLYFEENTKRVAGLIVVEGDTKIYEDQTADYHVASELGITDRYGNHRGALTNAAIQKCPVFDWRCSLNDLVPLVEVPPVVRVRVLMHDALQATNDPQLMNLLNPPTLRRDDSRTPFRLLEPKEDALFARANQRAGDVNDRRQALEENLEVLSDILMDLSPAQLLDLRKYLLNSRVPDKPWRLGKTMMALRCRHAFETEYAKDLMRNGELSLKTPTYITFDEWLEL